MIPLRDRKKLQKFVSNGFFVDILNELDIRLDNVKNSTIDQIIRMFTYCSNEPKDYIINNVVEYSKNSVVLGTRATKESYIFRYGPIEGILRFEKYSNLMSTIHKEQYKNGRQAKFLRTVDDYVNSGYDAEYAKQKISNRKETAAKKSAEAQHGKTDQKPNQIGYWLKKGFSEEAAIMKVSERQTTFTLEKCIEKYGLADGQSRWQARQDKWQATLNSKSPEEKKEINRKKASYTKPNYNSTIEYEALEFLEAQLGISIVRQIPTYLDEIQTHRMFDGKYENVYIEFNGDYWHCNPKKYESDYWHEVRKMTAAEIWEYDNQKKRGIEVLGSKLFVIWENEYKNNKMEILERFKHVIGR
jgi:G:T-mismatch repair DNA endonuclease (very short patch repair protein)